MLWWRYFWTAPNTLIGLTVGLLLGGRIQWVSGVAEIHGRWIARALRSMPVPAAAMTLGHVVLGCSLSDLDRTRRHERVHVRQYERWGPFFLPAYLLASLFLKLAGRDAYRGNPFEVEAYAIDDPSKP
ncbi:hypothetical protein LOC71_09020 [Rhodopirellula sp. JC740]|uniref:Signal peptide prediction n=1 Tax=Rhodopirellula halodulae TaxID=2894198 RepID=A0ABS8NFV0_9BACT|nr:hypothetical protein [Rhodopirellula sp. JC740]MCC9642413.1 hypothetical protein [Rhodopirellula sp. JC740]